MLKLGLLIFVKLNYMKRSSTLFLKLALLFIGMVVTAALIFFPQGEERNTNADFWQIYFRDPFLMYMYIAMIPFFVALHQALKLLGHIENNKVFSPVAVSTLRNIKYCAFTLAGLTSLTLPYVFMFGDREDVPGVIVVCFISIFSVFAVGVAAGVFEQLLCKAVEMKSENDLTV